MTTVHDPQDFNVGDTWELEFTCHDSLGNILALADAAIEWKLDDTTGEINILTKTVENGGVVLNVQDGSDGVCLVTVLPEESEDIEPGFYQDQLRVVLPGGFVSTQTKGRIDVKATIK